MSNQTLHTHIKTLKDAIDIRYWTNFQSLSLTRYPDDILIFSQNSNYSKLNNFCEIHDRFCLVIAIEGEFGVVISGKAYRVQKGKGVLIFPFQTHVYTYEYPQTQLLFATFVLKDDSKIKSLRENVFSLIESSYSEIELILDYWRNLPDSEEHIWSLSRGLKNFLELSVDFVDKNEAQLPRLLAQSQQLINLHLLTTKQLCTELNCSQLELSCLYKHYYGISVAEMLQHARIDRIIKFLGDDRFSIKEIADLAGFESTPSFCRFVRLKFKFTPMQLRHFFHNNPIQLQYQPHHTQRKLYDRIHRNKIVQPD